MFFLSTFLFIITQKIFWLFVIFICVAIVWRMLTQEHPNSFSTRFSDDARDVVVPKTGGEGKAVVVVGGGISGLSSAYFLVQAGFSKVVLLEKQSNVGGNNQPYFDDSAREHATTCIYAKPAQQPHYAKLCRELNITQINHNYTSAGPGLLKVGGRDYQLEFKHTYWTGLKFFFWNFPWADVLDGVLIAALLYDQFLRQPEGARSVKDVLGARLIKTPAFHEELILVAGPCEALPMQQ